MDAQPLLWIVPISGVVAVAVAAYFAYDVLRSPIGTPEMQKVAGAIYVAAVAFIQRQYRTIFLLAIGGMVLIGIVIFNLINIPLMFPRPGSLTPIVEHPAVLPTLILVQIVSTWLLVWWLGRRTIYLEDKSPGRLS